MSAITSVASIRRPEVWPGNHSIRACIYLSRRHCDTPLTARTSGETGLGVKKPRKAGQGEAGTGSSSADRRVAEFIIQRENPEANGGTFSIVATSWEASSLDPIGPHEIAIAHPQIPGQKIRIVPQFVRAFIDAVERYHAHKELYEKVYNVLREVGTDPSVLVWTVRSWTVRRRWVPKAEGLRLMEQAHRHARGLRNAVVRQHETAVAVEQHVRRLHVEVQDAVTMRGGERREQIDDQTPGRLLVSALHEWPRVGEARLAQLRTPCPCRPMR